MLVDIHTHMDDEVGGQKVLLGEEKEKYKKWVADLSMMKQYLDNLEKLSLKITGDSSVYACVLSVEPNSDFEKLIDYQKEDNRILPFISPDFTLDDEQMISRIKKLSSYSYGMKIHPII